MISFLKLVYLLMRIDGLCFPQNRASLKIKIRGRIVYGNDASVPGEPLGREYYSIPIFYGHRDSLRKAIHEVRHRVQWNQPSMRLLTLNDVPEAMRPYIRPDVVKKMSDREIDAQIFDEISLPLFVSGQIDAFLELMFRKSNPPKGS